MEVDRVLQKHESDYPENEEKKVGQRCLSVCTQLKLGEAASPNITSKTADVNRISNSRKIVILLVSVGTGVIVSTGGAATPAVVTALSQAGTAVPLTSIIPAAAAEATVVGAVSAIAAPTAVAAAEATVAAAATAGAAGAGAGVGTATTLAAGVASSTPILGWILGHDGYSWDCWKPILHDVSKEPSKGIRLQELFDDPRVKVEYKAQNPSETLLAKVSNTWGETFDIIRVLLEDGTNAAHAEIVEK